MNYAIFAENMLNEKAKTKLHATLNIKYGL